MSALVYEMAGNGVAWMTINVPEKRNALTEDVRRAMFAAVDDFNADDSARVLVVTGAGDRAFCAGGDLSELSRFAGQVPPDDYMPLFGRNVEVRKPTIAAVNGVALGGGFLLAQCCDLCIAADTARFGIPEARVGRAAPWAAPLVLQMPPRVAMQLLLTGTPLTAPRAFEIGLVNEVVPAGELRARAQAVAETIAANAPLSVATAKAMVHRVSEYAADALAAEVKELWRPVYESADAIEGPTAFVEKRPPVWRGR
jgi:enoyl-CoA hydratase/carnithine racemase